MLQGNEYRYEIQEPYELIATLSDRRANPFIRSRQRRNFDRRTSIRIRLAAMTFIWENGRMVTGRLLDISDTGVRILLDPAEALTQKTFTIDIPLLNGKSITCEKIWSRNGTEDALRYGARFIDLSHHDRTELRKRYLLETMLIAKYADAIIPKVKTPEQQQEIKTFFLVDVRRTLERLIEIDHMIAEGAGDAHIMQQCTTTLDELLAAGERLSALVDDDVLMKDVKQRVRMVLGHFIYQSTAFRRAFEKPHGYPGDYKTLELVYDDRVVSEGIGKYLDRYGINAPYSQAIRMRKNLMRDLLQEFISKSTAPELHILNLASGGCREIRELYTRELPSTRKVHFVCIDQDERALNFSREKLSELENQTIDVKLVQGNILKLDSIEVGPPQGFDMIYSIGIADYLQDRMLKKIFQDSFKKLAVGGTLVVAYKDKDRHKPVAFHWYGDWYFIPRNEQELLTLVYESLPKENITIDIKREPSGIIFFALLTKIK